MQTSRSSIDVLVFRRERHQGLSQFFHKQGGERSVMMFLENFGYVAFYHRRRHRSLCLL